MMLGRVVMWTAVMAGVVGVCSAPVALAESDESEAPESAVSSPPMEMDDPGTPGPRGIEVNFVGTHERLGAEKRMEMLLDANFGIGDRIQLKYERPYLALEEEDLPHQQGLGATEIGLKWRMVDHGGWGAAFYPQYQYDDGFDMTDVNGEPVPSEGRSYYLPLLLSKEVASYYTLAANVGYRRNLENRGDDLNFAFGVGRAVTGNGRVLAEIFSERDPFLQNRQTDVRVGYVFNLLPKSWVPRGMEFPAYVSFGHALGATEPNELVNSFVFGVSILKLPAGE
jgi:hypothetical protein